MWRREKKESRDEKMAQDGPAAAAAAAGGEGQDQHHYKFNVKMTCSGCSGAVERVLKKMEGMCYDMM